MPGFTVSLFPFMDAGRWAVDGRKEDAARFPVGGIAVCLRRAEAGCGRVQRDGAFASPGVSKNRFAAGSDWRIFAAFCVNEGGISGISKQFLSWKQTRRKHWKKDWNDW